MKPPVEPIVELGHVASLGLVANVKENWIVCGSEEHRAEGLAFVILFLVRKMSMIRPLDK